MPSLSPGTPGTKEAYGISILNDDLSIVIPPKAFKHYGLEEGDVVLLTTTHVGEGGIGILNREKAYTSVFKKFIDRIDQMNTFFENNNRYYALTQIRNGKVFLTEEMLTVFNLKKGDQLLVIKSTTITMSYTPIEIWKYKFEQRGLFEAIENMKKLEIF
jgi:bifunctional DNA-binding transcriptional regulator/antitoxin component of YhaV-PrlF toxin-antitoxin module